VFWCKRIGETIGNFSKRYLQVLVYRCTLGVVGSYGHSQVPRHVFTSPLWFVFSFRATSTNCDACEQPKQRFAKSASDETTQHVARMHDEHESSGRQVRSNISVWSFDNEPLAIASNVWLTSQYETKVFSVVCNYFSCKTQDSGRNRLVRR